MFSYLFRRTFKGSSIQGISIRISTPTFIYKIHKNMKIFDNSCRLSDSILLEGKHETIVL